MCPKARRKSRYAKKTTVAVAEIRMTKISRVKYKAVEAIEGPNVILSTKTIMFITTIPPFVNVSPRPTSEEPQMALQMY
ncbi:predicted protein [Sclerotinia sclerotiorum 1980 UF-70]|uniref:Uncharacterized protein n=1 Tax=Sclerotinia sclerotiorum (strain ATCC 18683 / 1980 / Ss-1) TaxID=665079 RepID=A7E828_SCLS1|nr:predicted protein [Sclerotinia sclerotiorum 1980 UF-70]EDN96530.1 predicted protein [Sclerotinia sclerotiorum 1980 UF-70]